MLQTKQKSDWIRDAGVNSLYSSFYQRHTLKHKHWLSFVH